MEELDFSNILALAEKAAENARKVREGTQRKAQQTGEACPDEFRDGKPISITRTGLPPRSTRTRYYEDRSKLWDYLREYGYEGWYVREELSDLPAKLITDDGENFLVKFEEKMKTDKFEGLIEAGVRVWKIDTERLMGDLSNPAFAYYVDETKSAFRETLENGNIIRLTPDEQGRVRLGSQISKQRVEKLWDELRGEEVAR
jgi:hypothetical protein